ncbi:IPT/TIG domain-containing protein [bacterium]|nr:IPT/TIG domain-containing protein [bacterium]
MRRLSRFAWLLVVLAMLACMPRTGAPATGQDDLKAATHRVPTLVGRVDYGAIRNLQANVGTLLDRSTVSLFDAVTGETRTATVSDASGNFSLSMPGFIPATNGVYILEAVKGLGAQLPGRTAPRLRTFVQYTTAGWLSLTNGEVGGIVAINAHTTAVAIVSALDPIGLPAPSAMGKVNPASPGSLKATPSWVSHPDTELNQLAADVVTTLGRDDDPLASTNAVRPQIHGVTPTSGSANQVVSVTGVGFAGGTTTLRLGAMTVPGSNVLAVTRDRIVFTVPVGATSGNLVVNTNRGGDSNAVFFTVPNGAAVSIQAISPNPARPAGSVTLTGHGYSAVLTENVVNINGGSVTPDFANTTSLVFRVPAGATSGNVSVTVNGQTSNNYYLTIDSLTTPIAASVFPTVAPNKTIVAIKGQNFGPDGAVLIGDYQAEVVSWNPNVIRVKVPWHVDEGPQMVTIFAPLGIATQSLQVVDADAVNAWVNVPDLPAGVGGPGIHAYVGGEKVWVWGGNNSTKVAYMNLNPDGSFKDSNWTVSPFVLPEGTNQDDNPNSRVQIKNRIYYTVTNQLAAPNKSHINFASLDPYTGDVIGFGYDPINDLPPTWAGKDLALIASDRYVYIMGHGVSCTSDGMSCSNNPVGTMQARLLESGNIGQWEVGPNQHPYGEDGCPFIIGDVLYQIGGTGNAVTNASQQCVIDATGRMSNWVKQATPLLPNGDILSCQVMQFGRYYYYLHTWPTLRAFRGAIQDNLVPKPMTELTTDIPSTSGVQLANSPVQVQVGKYLYLISSNQGDAGPLWPKVARGTVR